MSAQYRLGIDAGGTFTDFVIADKATGETKLYKTLSTPSNPTKAIENGVKLIAEDLRMTPEKIVSELRSLHQRDDGRPQCADHASRRQDRPHLHRRTRGFDRDPQRPQGRRIPLRSRISGGEDACAALSAQGRARARPLDRRGSHAAARGRCTRRLRGIQGARRRDDSDFVRLVGAKPRAREARRQDRARDDAGGDPHRRLRTLSADPRIHPHLDRCGQRLSRAGHTAIRGRGGLLLPLARRQAAGALLPIERRPGDRTGDDRPLRLRHQLRSRLGAAGRAIRLLAVQEEERDYGRHGRNLVRHHADQGRA